MIKILFTAFYVDENILYFNEDSGNVVFTCHGMSILNIDLNNINLDDTNYDKDDPDTIILARILAWHSKLKKRKALKKKISEELMPIVWHLKRWRNFCLPEDEKKEIQPFLLSNAFNASVVYNFRVLGNRHRKSYMKT